MHATLVFAARDLAFWLRREHVTAEDAGAFADLLHRHLNLLNEQTGCVKSDGSWSGPSSNGRVEVKVAWTCPDSTSLSVDAPFFSHLAGNHLHFVSVIVEGQVFESRVVTAAELVAEPLILGSQPTSATTRLLDYFGVGISHIATGADHLVFLLALLLVAASGRTLFLWVTGFTLGHSISLALATFGVLVANTAMVEAFIGLSVLLVAIGVLARDSSLPAFTAIITAAIGSSALLLWASAAVPASFLVAATFLSLSYLTIIRRFPDAAGIHIAIICAIGVVHGLGFAGGLSEMMPGHSIAWPDLLSFNLGIEAGQLIFLAVVAILAFLLRELTSPRHLQHLNAAVGSVIACCGSYWWFSRIML